MGKLTDRLDKINEKLRKGKQEVDAKVEAVEGAVSAVKAKAAAKVEAVECAAAKVKDEAAAKVAAAECAAANTKAEAVAKVEAAKEAVEAAKAQVEERKDEVSGKVKANVDALKDKITTKCAEMEKKDWEEYIVSLLEYAEDCYAATLLLEAEAVLAVAMAAEELCDYAEKYDEEVCSGRNLDLDETKGI